MCHFYYNHLYGKLEKIAIDFKWKFYVTVIVFELLELKIVPEAQVLMMTTIFSLLGWYSLLT